MPTVLMIDNYDSFTYNLVQCFQSLSLEIETVRNDQITIREIAAKRPDYIVISPGPGRPENAGISMEVIANFAGKIPTLGVCLGMQCINEVFGGETLSAPLPVHGKTVEIEHGGTDIFYGISSPMTAALYHSLMVDVKNNDLRITSTSREGVVMSLEHKTYPLFGLQFHPESFMTPKGMKIIENFSGITGLYKR